MAIVRLYSRRLYTFSSWALEIMHNRKNVEWRDLFSGVGKKRKWRSIIS